MGSLSCRMLPHELAHGRGIRQAPARAQKPQACSCSCLCSQLLPRPPATHMLVNHSSDTFSLLGFLSESAKSKSNQQHYWQEARGLPGKLCKALPEQRHPQAGKSPGRDTLEGRQAMV